MSSSICLLLLGTCNGSNLFGLPLWVNGRRSFVLGFRPGPWSRGMVRRFSGRIRRLRMLSKLPGCLMLRKVSGPAFQVWWISYSPSWSVTVGCLAGLAWLMYSVSVMIGCCVCVRVVTVSEAVHPWFPPPLVTPFSLSCLLFLNGE